MWPFTGKRIFGSRWWAIAFVIFVCLQAIEIAQPTDEDGSALNAQQTQAMTDALNKF